MSLMLQRHKTTKTISPLSISIKEEAPAGFCFPCDGDVPPTDSSVLRSSLHHFVVRSKMDFRLLSLKTPPHLSTLLWSRWLPQQQLIHFHLLFLLSCHIKISSHISAKVYLRETEDSDGTRIAALQFAHHSNCSSQPGPSSLIYYI